MSKFSEFINDRGFPTEDAKRFLKERFCREIAACLEFASTANEARIAGSVLKTIVADMVADRVDGIKK